MAAAILEARRLTKRFGTRTAVENLSFTADPGDIDGVPVLLGLATLATQARGPGSAQGLTETFCLC